MARHGHRIDGLRVAQARQKILVAGKPITQAAFAERIGVHWVTMNRIENGKANVSLELAEKIATETGESRDALLGAAEEDEEAASMALISPTDDLKKAFAIFVDGLQAQAVSHGR